MSLFQVALLVQVLDGVGDSSARVLSRGVKYRASGGGHVKHG